MTKETYPDVKIYWHKEIYAAWQLSVRSQQPTVHPCKQDSCKSI